MDSSVALTSCARVKPRVMPVIVPRAYWFQYGAPRPVKAGTTYTPPVSATERASASEAAASGMSFSSSLSHCTAAPAVNTLPSRA